RYVTPYLWSSAPAIKLLRGIAAEIASIARHIVLSLDHTRAQEMTQPSIFSRLTAIALLLAVAYAALIAQDISGGAGVLLASADVEAKLGKGIFTPAQNKTHATKTLEKKTVARSVRAAHATRQTTANNRETNTDTNTSGNNSSGNNNRVAVAEGETGLYQCLSRLRNCLLENVEGIGGIRCAQESARPLSERRRSSQRFEPYLLRAGRRRLQRELVRRSHRPLPTSG